LKELDQKERYLKKRELLVNAELNITFDEAQLTAFLNSLYIEGFNSSNSLEL